MRTRHRLPALAGLVLVPLALTACGGGDPTSESTTGGSAAAGTITVGSANFPENVLLAEIYAGALRADGLEVTTNLNIGSRETYLPALEDGSIDLMPEYTGALLLNLDPDATAVSSDDVYAALGEALPDTLTALTPSEAEDKDSIVVTTATAEKYDLTSIGDLADVAGDLTLGAPPEFKEHAQGWPGLQKVYGVTFGTFKALDVAGPLTVSALKNGQVDAADLFSTDPSIAENDFVVLEDPEFLFTAQNVVPVIATDKATGTTTATLDAVSAALTTADLTAMLERTVLGKEDAADVAQDWLTEHQLG